MHNQTAAVKHSNLTVLLGMTRFLRFSCEIAMRCLPFIIEASDGQMKTKLMGLDFVKSSGYKVWKQMIKEVDINGDGEISYPEFEKMLEGLIGNQ